MPNKLHPHQNTILLKLASKASQKYSELQIRKIENDLFNYHLRQLVKTKLVKKENNLYSLTESGLDKLLLTDSKGKIYEGIRASVLIYIIKDNRQILAQKRTQEPYIGEESAGISGKVGKGELIISAAPRKMLEETGLMGNIQFVGILRKIRIHPDGLIDDGLFHVCVCRNPTGDLIDDNEFGINRWVTFDEAKNLDKHLKSSSDKSLQVLERILVGDMSMFYVEEEISIGSQ